MYICHRRFILEPKNPDINYKNYVSYSYAVPSENFEFIIVFFFKG